MLIYIFMAEKFLSKDNTDVLWEVLADDDSVPKTKETQETFVWLLPRFHAKHSASTDDLMGMNKMFISTIMDELENAKSLSGPGKNSPDKVLITSEDLKSERISEFDKKLKKQEDDFRNTISRPVPEEPTFKDTLDDAPLGDVTMVIERMMRERNLDISKIQKNHDVKQAEQWLSSTNPTIGNDAKKKTDEEIKLITIEKDELGISVPSEPLDGEPKHVSWGEDLTINISSTPPAPEPQSGSSSIFSKLKAVSVKTSDNVPSDQTAYPSPLMEDMSVPSLINQDMSSIDTTDVSRLYAYVTERFDRLEKLIMNTGRNM